MSTAFVLSLIVLQYLLRDDVDQSKRFLGSRDDVLRWQNEAVSSSVPQFHGVAVLDLHDGLCPVVRTTGSRVQEACAVSNCVGALGSISLLYSSGRGFAQVVQVTVVGWELGVVAPWVQDVLTVRVERQECLKSIV